MKLAASSASKRLLNRSMLLTGVAILTFSISGCGLIPLFDEKAQDKAACDKLSTVLTGQGANPSSNDQELLTWINTQNAFGTLADNIESDVLPLASMKFSSDIKELIKYLRKASSQSIFDRLASWTYGIDAMSQVSGHCILVSKD